MAELQKMKVEQEAQMQSEKDHYEGKLLAMRLAEESSRREIENLR